MRRLQARVGLAVLIVLCFFPIKPWLDMKPLDMRFGSWVMWLTSIGQLTALIGLAMFSVSLILIARFRIFEPYFGGLDRIFQAHRYLGIIGFLLMLVHPVVLAVRYVPISVLSAAQFFVPTMADLPKALGIGALLLMMVLLAATLLAHWRYQFLLATHRFLGAAFMIGVLHALSIQSDVSGSRTLTLYCGGLALFATGAYLYRTVFSRMIPKHSYVVTDVRRLDPLVTEVVLDPINEPLSFEPGQFVFVSFSDKSLSSEPHPFTISSAPHERQLRLVIKALGDWTSKIPLLEKGAATTIEGPFGGFTEARAIKKSEVWVAGGIGVTPFLSRARALGHSGLEKRIDFYYTTNTRDEMVFLSELSQIASGHPQLRIIPCISIEQGFLTATQIQEHSGGLDDKDVFVCGPPVMMQSILRQCRALGLRSSQLHAEEFSML